MVCDEDVARWCRRGKYGSTPRKKNGCRCSQDILVIDVRGTVSHHASHLG